MPPKILQKTVIIENITEKSNNMKKLEFTTGKGGFVIVDGTQPITGEAAALIITSEWSRRVEDLTEDQAREIVDEPRITGIGQYVPPDDLTGWLIEDKPMGKCYSKTTSVKYFDYKKENYSLITALDSLHSLIKSKGWYVNQNPVQGSIKNLSEEEQAYRQIDADWLEAERKTLFNPVIFKIN